MNNGYYNNGMSNVIYFIPAGAEIVFTKEELSSLSGKEICDQYYARAEAYSRKINLVHVPCEEYEGVRVVSDCAIIDAHGISAYTTENLALQSGIIGRFIKANNAHHYVAEKEDFSIYTAIGQAQEAGKQMVVTENIS